MILVDSEFTQYAEAAWRGARLLDEFDPGWIVHINSGMLNQMECDTCVLGQPATEEEPYYSRLVEAEAYAWEHDHANIRDRWETLSSMPTDWFSQFFGFDLEPEPRATLTARFVLLTAYWRWELDIRRSFDGKRPAQPLDPSVPTELEDMP